MPWIKDINQVLPHPFSQIKEKLSDYERKLQEAQDLLHSAQGKTRQADSLMDKNKANLAALEVKMDTNGYMGCTLGLRKILIAYY